jgi:hypothetical protein
VNDLDRDHFPEVIGSDTYIVTLKCEGEALPVSNRAIFCWALSHASCLIGLTAIAPTGASQD